MRGLFDLLQRTVTQARHKMYTVPHTFSELVGQHQAIMDAIMEGDLTELLDSLHREYQADQLAMLAQENGG